MKHKHLAMLFAIGSILTRATMAQDYLTITCNDNNAPSILLIQNGQTAELVSIGTVGGGNAGGYAYDYNQVSSQIQGNTNFFSLSVGSIVAGPATITLKPSYAVQQFSGRTYTPTFATVKIIPQSYDPNKTLIIPPGTNQVQITLQVSPDLVNWTTATNGIYGSPNTAQFFRIREDRLVSQ